MNIKGRLEESKDLRMKLHHQAQFEGLKTKECTSVSGCFSHNFPNGEIIVPMRLAKS
jgi:hypothetical protein